jgi:aryl-alcohol dehydrogenase-like predicted oxidoreductase
MVPEVVTLAPGFVVSRIAKGNWQLAERHGAPYARAAAIDAMRRFVEAGITLFDCADHYVGVEALIGEFRRRHPDHARRLRVSTKLVPDLESLPRLGRRDVEDIVNTSLARLGQERLDLVQFHWWDYRVPGYVEAMHWLDDLKSSGKVELIGTTNFDTARLAEIVASGVRVATNQLQYSVLDHRPENGLAAFCAAQGIKLLCYGTLAGGFIAERWLGAPEPRAPFANRSLVKYRLIIDDFGGWDRFQELLAVLDAIAKRHRVSLASVAIRYVLDKPGAAVALVGARNATHLDDLGQIVSLDDGDRAAIARVVSRAPGPRGDCYELERAEDGPHSAIMWKNQNTGGAPADGPSADAPPAAARPAAERERR